MSKEKNAFFSIKLYRFVIRSTLSWPSPNNSDNLANPKTGADTQRIQNFQWYFILEIAKKMYIVRTNKNIL